MTRKKVVSVINEVASLRGQSLVEIAKDPLDSPDDPVTTPEDQMNTYGIALICFGSISLAIYIVVAILAMVCGGTDAISGVSYVLPQFFVLAEFVICIMAILAYKKTLVASQALQVMNEKLTILSGCGDKYSMVDQVAYDLQIENSLDMSKASRLYAAIILCFVSALCVAACILVAI